MRLADRLGQGRVRMDQRGDLGGDGLPVRDQHRLGDQIRHVGADHVDPEDRSAALLG